MQAKTCKKVLSLLLSLAMLCGLLVTTAFAAEGDSAAYTVSSVNAAPGETVEVAITIDNQIAEGIMVGSLSVEYDITHLTMLSFDPGAVISSTRENHNTFYVYTDVDANTGEKYINEIQFCKEDFTPFTASGELAIMTFLVDEDTPDGIYEIKIVPSPGVQWFNVGENWEPSDIVPTLTSGSITVGSGSGDTKLDSFAPVNNTGTTPAAKITAPEGGWVEGENTFTVACDNACVVAVANGDGTYTPLTATANADGTYSFTVDNLTADTELVVALKGDANGDGTITITDSTAIARALLEPDNSRYAELSPLLTVVGDADGNGAITITDGTTIARALLEPDNSRFAAIAW